MAASAFGYSTEYILEHSLPWLIWACRQAARQRSCFINAFYAGPVTQNEELEESKENLTKIGIGYE